jgi:hypothetical protein
MARTTRRRQHSSVQAAQRGQAQGAERVQHASPRRPRWEAGTAIAPDVRGRGARKRPVQRHAIHAVERRHAGDRFRPVPHHPSGMGDLFPRQLAGTAAMLPAPPGRLHPSLRALGNQGTLKFGEGPMI